MTDNRGFRIDDRDVEELRAETPDQRLVDMYSHWVQYFAPQVDEVIAEISLAFAGTQLGTGPGLLQSNGLDGYASVEELQQLRQRDEKNDWKLISYADLERCYAAPTFFDAQGFIFHLPAFLIAELNDRHPYGFIDRLFQAEEHPIGWRGLLTATQRQALISVFKLVREHPNFQDDRNEIDLAMQGLKH